ncbi:MAG: oxidoreductase [Williamsia sp.]|nr:oxidoreductase [Williamsia sp.]
MKFLFSCLTTITGFYLFLSSQSLYAQKIDLLSSGTKTSVRGLSVVNDKVIWVSGSNGMVGKSVDSGRTWKWILVKGFEKRDFRDIEAQDAATAIIIAIGEPACILKTHNGGETWKLVYENKTPGMFLDAMEFWNDQSGIVIGDPINGRFFIARTFDEGDTWHELSPERLPAADSGEACFASSGTNIRKLDRSEACFVTGGKRSRLMTKGKAIELPLVQGGESTGANSVAVRDDKKLKNSEYLVVVGGDFKKDTVAALNCAITKNGGKTWLTPASPPHGYRSCVEFVTHDQLICCGTSGVDLSDDGGMVWRLISGEGFHVCRKAKNGKAVFLAGANGKIGRLSLK